MKRLKIALSVALIASASFAEELAYVPTSGEGLWEWSDTANWYIRSAGDGDEGWKLVKQFIYSAGGWFLSMNVGSKLFAALAQSTGLGYGVGVAIDSAASAAFAWAIGESAKEYFRRDYLGKSKMSKEELGRFFRNAFNNNKK